jgi:hypothetical protein
VWQHTSSHSFFCRDWQYEHQIVNPTGVFYSLCLIDAHGKECPFDPSILRNPSVAVSARRPVGVRMTFVVRRREVSHNDVIDVRNKIIVFSIGFSF